MRQYSGISNEKLRRGWGSRFSHYFRISRRPPLKTRELRAGTGHFSSTTSQGWAEVGLIHGYRDSSQSRIVPSFAHGARDFRATGVTFSMAFRFISRSTFAYRFVVVGLAWPSMWLMVERSTPDARSATAVLCRM